MKIPGSDPIARSIASAIQKAVAPAATTTTGKSSGGVADASSFAGAASPGASALMSTVLSETAKMAQADMAAARTGARGAHAAKLDAKADQIDTAAKKQEANRANAWVNVGVAVATSLVSVAGGVAGAVAGVGGATAGAASAASQAIKQIGIEGGKIVSDTIEHVKAASHDAAAATFGGLGEKLKSADVNGLIQWVLKESYGEQMNDLKSFAGKVQHFNDLKSNLRDQVSQARTSPSAKPGRSIQELEEQLATVGDDAQLANVDLQNMLQKSQQTLQTMSNVSKMLHDTAMAVVRKIG